MGFPGGSDSKESACNAGDLGSIPGSGRSLEKRMATHFHILAWKTPWRSLVGYSPWGCKETDMTEQLITHNQYYALNILRSNVVDFPCGLVIKNLPCNARDTISIPGWGAKILYARKQCAATTEACIFWSPHN